MVKPRDGTDVQPARRLTRSVGFDRRGVSRPAGFSPRGTELIDLLYNCARSFRPRRTGRQMLPDIEKS